MSNPSYNYEIVNRASLACGPMVKWAIAQVSSPTRSPGQGPPHPVVSKNHPSTSAA